MSWVFLECLSEGSLASLILFSKQKLPLTIILFYSQLSGVAAIVARVSHSALKVENRKHLFSATKMNTPHSLLCMFRGRVYSNREPVVPSAVQTT